MTNSASQRLKGAQVAGQDRIRILDMTNLRVANASRHPTREWAFVAVPGGSDHRDFFLFTDGSHAYGKVAAADAVTWLEAILSGRLCADAIARSVEHLGRLEGLTRLDGLQAEREAFAQQFHEQAVKQGLSAFLDKRTAPFSLSQAAVVSLTALLAWVREQFEINPSTEEQTRSQAP